MARLSSDIRSQHPFIRRVQSQTACSNISEGGVSHSSNSNIAKHNNDNGGNGGRGGGRKPATVVAISPSQLGPGRELSVSTTNNNINNGDALDDNDYDDVVDDTFRQDPQQEPHHLENSSSGDPFAKILTLADSNISQAESILSSLGCGGERRSGLPSDSEEEDELGPVSLGSDIESNIRRLERTQAKINAALETFR